MSDNRRKRYNPGQRSRPDNNENIHRNSSAPLRGSSRNSNSQFSHQNVTRMNSYDHVRKIVQEEGRTARNLVIYNVPVRQHTEYYNKRPLKDQIQQKNSRSKSRSVSEYDSKSFQDLTKSPKSDSGTKKTDRRARYWKFLFDNLQRAVDAIYDTCETDESVVECKEVIMMLDNSTRDFKSLIERLHTMKAYEDATKEGDRPTSIAWEVRKMSPGKTTSQGQGPANTPTSPAQRVLQFTDQNKTEAEGKGDGNSWADKVRGKTSHTSPQMEGFSTPTPGSPQIQSSNSPVSPGPVLPSPPPKQNGHMDDVDTDGSTTIEDDNEGWETVQRPAKGRVRNSPSQRSLENLSGVGKSPAKLQRTYSDPHTGGQRRPPWNHGGGKGRTPPQKTVFRSSQGDGRDSEKENRPQTLTLTKSRLDSSRSGSTGSLSKPTISYSSTVQSSRSPPTIQRKSPSTVPTKQARLDGREVNSKPEVFPPEVKEEVLVNKTEEGGKAVSPVMEESATEDEEAMVIDKALVNAMEEEEELTNQLEEEQQQALQTAIEEEETWLKELAREENTVIDVETETETENELGNTMSSLESSQPSMDWDTLCAQYEAQSDSEKNKSWGEMVEEDEQEARTPGHAVHMHEKLSSPSRKRSPTESRKRHEQKQAKARELREKLMQDKAERLKEISKKVEEVRAWKEELLQERKGTIQRKLEKAEERRQLQMKIKAQKAHEEEAKGKEIEFINTLEAQNKRHEIMSKHQVSEARLQDIQDERQRRHEEKLAKEAAVEERRKALEADRQARLKEMEEKRKQRSARAEQQQLEREKERLENIRAKEREREERLAVLNAQHQQHIQELQKKIQQKQDETSQRHQENLQQIREKAFEMSILKHSTEEHNEAPNVVPYDHKKLCIICNVLITSEVYLLSHLRGKKHQQALHDNNSGKAMSKQEIENFNLKHIVNAPSNSTHPKIVSEKERHKSMKKRAKKLRQRMTTRGHEYENSLSQKQQQAESGHKAKIHKIVRDINKYLQTQDSGPWPQNKVSALDRALGEISRILDKKSGQDQTALRVLGGLSSLCRLLNVLDNSTPDLPPVIPPKTLTLTSNVCRQACKSNYDNCHYILLTNKTGVITDLLIQRLSFLLPDTQSRPGSGLSTSSTQSTGSGAGNKLPYDAFALSLMQLMSTVLSCLAKNSPLSNVSEASAERMSGTVDTVSSRGNDLISYIVSVGIVDKLTQYFRKVQGPIDDDRDGAEFLQHCLGLLVAMTKVMSKRIAAIFEKKKLEDPTQLISTYEATELVGIVSLLYGMLLHSGAPSRGELSPPELPQHTLAVILTGIKMLNNMATFSLEMLQKALGEEGMSLEFRHIASYLMWYCSRLPCEELLHEVILCVGYFTILNPENQIVIQSGQSPTVLQQMCSLPFQYFSDPRLTGVLFPTLIACCYNNKSNTAILEQELSCALLSNFIEEKILEAQAKSTVSSSTSKKVPEKDCGDQRMSLLARFPQEQLTAAQEYFKI
ncbi:S phase cyclin A-associated protein in the endoplasmic reticulum-like isoform X2 [Ostrea edulis]|uniref:S phase cyclin A-associated protein in the endoplasmic reticulum-like isoform X2 n=1 Tax=Ostrea edulis TaxID=37623 RepID=UPI0024AF8337|nr:S phase cyclin A-associated protein in the endoplasmic reticulum-like isoform X2 [Ostrea edulis]